jgi:hypothetical protein
VLALRGYVRLVGLPSDRPAEDSLEMYREAMAVARRDDEKKLVLAGMGALAHPEALEAVERYMAEPALRDEAAAAVAKIARAISGSHKEEARAALERVLLSSASGGVLRQAQEALEFLRRYEDYLTAWQVSGPYEGKDLFKTEFAPERPGGGGARWRPWVGQGKEPWRVDFMRIDGIRGSNRAVYLRAGIWSPRRQEAVLELGSDDGIKAWLGGELVHAKDVARGLTEGEDRVVVTLDSGWNVLLLKITQGGGDWAACCRIRAPDGSKLEGLRTRAE